MENRRLSGGLHRKSNAIMQARDVGRLGWDTVEEIQCRKIQELFCKSS